MNKILSGVATVTLLVTAFAPALSLAQEGGQLACGLDGHVCNVQMADTSTGDNSIADSSGFCESTAEKNGDNGIWTGTAASWADANTLVNSDLREGCCDGESQDNSDNHAFVKNIQKLSADSGNNSIANSMAFMGESETFNNDGNEIRTGLAQAVANATTVANSNLSEGCCGDQFNGPCNSATVINVQKLGVNSGGNAIANSFGGDSTSEDNDGNEIHTGNAIAQAMAFTIVNSNILRAVEETD